MLKYWQNIIQSDNTLIADVYRMLVHDANNGVSYNGNNWDFNIKTILTEIGMLYLDTAKQCKQL